MKMFFRFVIIVNKNRGDVMSRGTAGVIFIFTAIHVYCVKLITAALYSISSTTSSSSWGGEEFRQWVSYIGPIPNIISIACLIVGVYCLINGYTNKA